jgi:protein transport protein SEC23
MKPVIRQTGGLIVLADSFGQSVFKESFRRVFRRWDEAATPPNIGHLMMGFGASLEVITSREFKVSGAIGPCTSLKKASASVSETEIGEGGTCAWSLGAIDPATSVALYFDVAANTAGSGPSPNRRHHMQLITY